VSTVRLPVIDTPRLRLAAVDTALDSVALGAALQQVGTFRYLNQPAPKSDDEARAFIARLAATGTDWTIRLRSDAAVIGFCSIEDIGGRWAEVGIVIGTAWHRSGFGREALRAVIEFALSQSAFSGVVAGVKPDNEAARALVETLGFEKIGNVPGARSDEIAYRLLPVQYYEATGWEPPRRRGTGQPPTR
jgi:RimJ/RimL family protein N-acetyltransferase